MSELCTARLFSPLCIQILPGHGRPDQPFNWHKNRDTALRHGEDRVPLRSLVLTQYRSVTDGRTDGYATRSISGLRRAVKSCSVQL